MQTNTPDRRLRLPEVLHIVGFKTTHLYNKMNAGTFPKQRKDGRMSYWLESEVQAWLKQNTDPNPQA